MNATRLLRILVVIVFAAVAAAIVMRVMNTKSPDAEPSGDLLLQGVPIAAVAPRINAVEAQQGDMTIRVQRDATGWSVASRDGFPAKSQTIQDVVRGLILLQKSQRMTAKPQRHGDLDLAWPDSKGIARRIRIFAEGSTDPVADVIIGRAVQAPAGVYARLYGDDQAWRCVGSWNAAGDLGAWLAGPVADISSEEIQQVDFDGLVMTRKDTQWSVARPDGQAADANPKIEAMKGTLPYLLTGFQPEDVRRESAEDLAHSNQVIAMIHLDASHTVEARLWLDGDAAWVRLAPSDCTGEPNAKLNQFAEQWKGWVFKLPSWRANYLKPLFALAPAATEPAPVMPAGDVGSSQQPSK